MKSTSLNSVELIEELTAIGIALSTEKDHARLLELILTKAMAFTNADGATLYETNDDQQLEFKIMLTKSLGIHEGGVSGHTVQRPLLPLYDHAGHPNSSLVATYVATSGQSVNIADAYKAKQYDFSGTKAFDKTMGYRSKSFLTVPMTNHLNEVIGVLQLINAQDRKTQKIIPFSLDSQKIIESLTSQAAVSITNRNLIEAQKKLFYALIQLIANAIDEKSPYTGGHCRRVPVITRMLADAVCRIDQGPLKKFSLNEDEKYELEVSAWLHDCGKLITPEHVVDKSTKLQTVFDRIHLLDTRFEVLKRDAVISHLMTQFEKKTGHPVHPIMQDHVLLKKLEELEADQAFLRACNIGKETIRPEEVEHIERIAKKSWQSSEGMQAGLTSDEIHNLMISRGTLTNNEREIINNHVKVTRRMLEALPYPKAMRHVPEYAGSHHEKMNGTGYPLGLTGDKMAIQCRMIAIADIFEALSACDRPYKKGMPLSKCLSILGEMKQSGHIDPDLFDVFIHEKVYLHYAEQYLEKDQLDQVDLQKIPGYRTLP